MEPNKPSVSDKELIAAFRQAHRYRDQIYKLADKYECHPFDIASRLEELGELVDTGVDPQDFINGARPIYGRPPDPLNEPLIKKLYEAGLCDTEIARILDVNAKRIERWRKRNHLPKNKYRRHRGRG